MSDPPGPPPLPILGNMLDLDRKNTIQSFVDLADTYGPIYKLRLGGTDRIFVTGHELVDELCSRKDFVKIPVGLVRSQKELTPEGLFTADYGQPSWDLAHRVLLPAFGPLSIQDMFAEMHDMISQMALKWARFGDDNPIDVTADFTRLTLDTIALCAMDMRFNSFYKDELHPFVDAMMATFSESQDRSIRPPWLNSLMWKANQRFSDNKDMLHEIVSQVIAKRRASPSDKKDLVNAMLKGRDPVTGKQLSDDIIMDNMISFLIAGHETTSALLSFVFGFLMLNPEKYAKLQSEIDEIIGPGPMTIDHLSRLPYTKACLREALRLHPPAAGFSLSPLSDAPVLLGGKWLIKPEDACIIILPKLHRDPIFGEDVENFNPDRMLEESFRNLPPNCYKPFGNGARACIGSDFAMQEAIMATAMLMQKFDFKLRDFDWKMTVKQTATLKPHNLFMYAKLRPGLDILSLQRDFFHIGSEAVALPREKTDELQPMSIFFGSNTGTCQSLADRLATSALQRGFRCTVKPLNEAVENIPHNPVVFISSTHYEGHPPDNAAKFMAWLARHDGSFDVDYAVFGCGNREWQQTFQEIPTRIYLGMKEKRARPLAVRGLADAGEGNMIGDFDTWQADHLWPGLAKIYGKGMSVNGLRERDNQLSFGQVATVNEVRALTTDEDRPKYHIDVELPEGTTYEVGDYLDVYPRNSPKDVDRLTKALRLDTTDPLITVLSNRELNQPASLKQLQTLAESCVGAEEKEMLEAMKDSPGARPSILQLLNACPSISIPPEELVNMLPPIRPRPYSISSSPLASPRRCTLTWSLITRDSVGADLAPGLASHYLAGLQHSDSLNCAVRPGQSRFRPPTDPKTPMIMVCAGAGLAPFAGFIADRAEKVERDPGLRSVMAPALLFVGCRSPEHAIYASELKRGGVDVRYAYSRVGGLAGHVQDRVWADREDLVKLWDGGARVYVCGSQAVSLGVKEVVRKIYREISEERCGAKTDAEVDEWWIEILRERYAVDVL